MDKESFKGILPVHSDTVITDAQTAYAAGGKFNLNDRCACISSIIEKLLNDTYGTLDDLTCFYPVGGNSIKNINPAHYLPP